MANTYHRFLKQGIDLACLGIEQSADKASYFCTPKGASIIGWAGVDGIHYCFIRGFGEMVFAVSPMNTAPDYVHPLAETFGDFLRLLLACGDSAALEQAWMFDQAQFETFLEENPVTEEQERTLSEIAEKMNLTAMEQPLQYIRALQASFDYGKIKYTEDYYDVEMNPAAEAAAPEWKVYFDGNFWGHHGRDHAGKEVSIEKQFTWAGCHWRIPAAYLCSKGLVIDFCMRVEADDIRSFMKKWNLSQENDSYQNFTREQQMEMELDNPFYLHFEPQLQMNGKTLRPTHGCSVCFDPCVLDGFRNDLESEWAVDHYGLDTSYGWMICRSAFPWEGKRRPEIKTLSLTMEQQPVSIPGPHFTMNSPNDSFHFIHPVSQEEYTLTVQELEQETMPKNCFGLDLLYPTHYTVMSYTLSPESAERITVSDCSDNDKPIDVEALGASLLPDAKNSAMVGIIGGADGPTAIVFGRCSQGKLHTACSSLHFEPVSHDITWRITFHEKLFDDHTLTLL